MPSELEELVGFLHSDQPAVRQIALDNVVGFSTGPQAQLFAYDNYRAIKDLKILARDTSRIIVQQSVTILANLCDDVHMRKLIVEDKSFVEFLTWKIVDINNTSADIMCILLTNIAKDDAITQVFDIKDEKKGFVIDALMDCFVKGYDRNLNKYANHDYLAYFFADISRFLRGRNWFVNKNPVDDVYPISKLLVFTEKYDSKTRREGVASTIKNSLFDAEKHEIMLKDESINLLPYILLPITNHKDSEIDEEDMFNLPDELQLLPDDKERDPVPEIICVHLESILLLCTTKAGREYMREKSVYPLVRELYKNVENEDVSELCNRIVNMLMRGEPEEGQVEEIEEEEEEESDDDAVVEVL